MAQKPDTRIFADAEAVRLFTLRQNARVVAWVTDNWERCEGLTGPVHKSTVSRALTSMPIVEPVLNAMDIMFDEMRDDPWAWCKPPESVDLLSEYAPLNWWYKVLKLKMAVPWARFERMAAQPLKAEDAEFVQERLDDWRKRLSEACDQFKADRALVRALESDGDPEFQHWVVDDGETRMLTDRERGQLEHGSSKLKKPFRRRVGNAGLHGASPEEIGLAYALADATLTLPMVEDASLSYSRPRIIPQHDHYSEAIEPWDGDEFEGVEFDEVEYKQANYLGKVTYRAKHRVCYYWDGQRYLVQDVEPFAWIHIQKNSGEESEWRVPTSDERDILETGVTRKHKTREEFIAAKDEWIADVWASQKEAWEENDPSSYINKKEFPDGVPRSFAEERFEAMLERVDDEVALDEQREVSRGRMAFRQQLRRRAA